MNDGSFQSAREENVHSACLLNIITVVNFLLHTVLFQATVACTEKCPCPDVPNQVEEDFESNDDIGRILPEVYDY